MQAPPDQTLNSDAGDINVLEILIVLARYWKTLVFAPLAMAVLVAGYSLTLPNMYTAKAVILPGDDNSSSMMGAMMAQMGGLAGLASGLGGGTKADLYVTLSQSEPVMDRLIDRYQLMKRYQVQFRSQAYARLDGATDIGVGKKDGLISIEVSDEDPKLAAAMANSTVEELGRLAAGFNMTSAGKNRAYLQERLAKAGADLAAAEEKLKSFQSRNKTLDVPDQAKATLEGVAQLRAQQAAQEVALAGLQQQFTAQSREVKMAQASISNLKAQIARMEGAGAGGAMPGVGSLPQLGQEYVRLMREYKIQETLVELLTKQYEMTKLNEVKDVTPFQVVQIAKVPELKSRPKRSLMVILAAFGTLCVALPVVFLRDFFQKIDETERKRWQELRALLPKSLCRKKA